MRWSWLVTTAAVLALPAAAAPDPGGAAPAAAQQGPPAAHARPGPPSAASGVSRRPAPVVRHVDINSAGREELMTLPGIGAAEAGRIIANRPYLTKTGLVTKNVLAVGPFVSVRNFVVAMPRSMPKGKPP